MKSWLGVSLLYLAGALLFLWPLPLSLGEAIWGDRFDAWTTLWLIGHFAEKLRTGTLTAQTTDILFPMGYNLWSFGHAALQFLGALLVVAGVPLVAAYNLLLIGGVASSGLGTHLLGRELSGSHRGGFLAGILFCTTPYLYGEGAAGCIELVAAGLLPLHAWALLRLVRQPGRGRLLVATVSLAVIGPFNWYYTLFAGIFGLGFAAWQARETGWRAGAWVLASLLLAGLSNAPLIPLVRRETPSRPPIPPSLFTEGAAWEQSNQLADAETPVTALTEELLEQHDAMQVIRNSTQLRTLASARFSVNPLKSTPGALIYLVGISLGLAGGKRTRGWLILAGGATLLTLGPFLLLDDHPPLPEWSARFPLPYYYAYTYLPFFAKAYRPYRLGVIAALCLAAAAAGGSAAFRSRWLGGAIALMGLYAFAQPLIVGDKPALRALADARVPVLYQHLRELPPGAVIEVPLQYQPLTVGNARYQYFQLFHQHPLLNCNQLIRRPDLLAFRDYVAGNRFLQTLMDLARTPPPYEFSPEDLKKLYQDGFRYVVVHTSEPKDAVELAGPMGDADLIGEPALRMLRETLGNPLLEDGEGQVFGLPETPPEGALRWDGADVVEVPILAGLPLVLKEDSFPIYAGNPAPQAISFWVHGIQGQHLGVRAAGELQTVTLDASAWIRVELRIAGGPVGLEAPPGETLKIELQRIQLRLAGE